MSQEHNTSEIIAIKPKPRGRGAISDEVQAKAKELLGIESMTVRELRLMPYIQYVMMNEQRIEPTRINQEERAILSVWREKGWIEGGAGGLAVSKQFWDAMSEILWLSYVDVGK